MRNIFVAVIKTDHNNIDLTNLSKRIKNDYTIIKIKSHRKNLKNGDTYIDITPMELAYKSEMIYNVHEQHFYKHRYDINGSNTATMVPDKIKPLFEAIIAVSELKPIDELKLNHKKSDLIEAIYLTGKLRNYVNNISLTEYELIRYKYGKSVNPNFLEDLIADYPEHLI